MTNHGTQKNITSARLNDKSALTRMSGISTKNVDHQTSQQLGRMDNPYRMPGLKSSRQHQIQTR